MRKMLSTLEKAFGSLAFENSGEARRAESQGIFIERNP